MQDALVDFHLHTTCSDGAWSPGRLFDEIRKRALSHFCVTDHDNMDAYPVPSDLQERCIAGLEIDTYGFDQTIHVLAYGVRQRDGSLLARLKQQQSNRSVRARLIVERLNQLGVGLTFDQVLDEAKTSKSVGRPHIARALVASRHCGSMQDAFDEYLAEGRSAYVGLDRLAVSEAIQLIHAEGALAILAHPRRLRNQNNVRELCTLFDGIEVVHPTADREYERQLLDLVDTNALVATGGTDFHARSGETQIGISFPQARIDRFLEQLHDRV